MPIVLNVVGARPQFIKVAPVIRELEERGVRDVLVHTGQHYDASLSDDIFADLGLREPDVNLQIGSGSHAEQTGRTLMALESVFMKCRPDAVIVYGDTNATIAGALAASKLKIPLAHVEAGLRSYNRDMPEELNRVATDHLSDLLLTPTDRATANLRAEGREAVVCQTGDVMVDALGMVDMNPEESLDWWPDGQFVACTLHRAENTDHPDRLCRVLEALSAMSTPVILMAHPRLRTRAEEAGLDQLLNEGNLTTRPPVPYRQLLATLRRAGHVVTDSGGIQKEAFLLRVPCTTLRMETEWTETLEGEWNALAGDRLTDLDDLVGRQPQELTRNPFLVDGPAAPRIVDAVLELT